MGGFREFITSNADARGGGVLTEEILREQFRRHLPPPEDVQYVGSIGWQEHQDLLRTDAERLQDEQVQDWRDTGILYRFDQTEVPLRYRPGTGGYPLEYLNDTYFDGQNTATITVGSSYDWAEDDRVYKHVKQTVEYFGQFPYMSRRRPFRLQVEYVTHVLSLSPKLKTPPSPEYLQAYIKLAKALAAKAKANPELLLEDATVTKTDAVER